MLRSKVQPFRLLTGLTLGGLAAMLSINILDADEREQDRPRVERREHREDGPARQGAHERLNDLRAEYRRLEQHAKELEQAIGMHRLHKGEGGEAERHERMEQLAVEMNEIRRRGAQVREEMHAIERALRGDRPHAQTPPRRDPREGAESLQRRIHHLHVAADNLQAAGMHEQAEDLRKHAEHMVREHAARHRPDDQREQRVPRHESEIGELREEVGELRHELREVMELVEELLEERAEAEEEEDGEDERDDEEEDGDEEGDDDVDESADEEAE